MLDIESPAGDSCPAATALAGRPAIRRAGLCLLICIIVLAAASGVLTGAETGSVGPLPGAPTALMATPAPQRLVVTGDTTFTLAGSPYLIADTLAIDDGASLTIDPGVVVHMQEGAALVVLGAIHCVGTASQMIVFEPEPGGWYWSMVGLIGVDGTAEVQYTSFRMGRWGTFQGHNLRGILTVIDSDLLLTDCLFHDARKHGISVANCSGLIARNTLTQIVSEPMDINDSSCDVIDNVIRVARQDAIDYNDSIGSPRISGNLIDRGEDDGLDLDRFHGTVSGNIILECVDKGISASVYSNLTIENNIVYDCAMGLGITAGSVVEVKNNTLTGCIYGMRGYEKIPGYGGATISGTNMLLWDNTVTYHLDAVSTVSLTYSNVVGDTLLAGEGNINADPLLVAPGSDFHLLAGSPCIDAGLGDAATPPFDYEGDPRADDPTVPNTGGGSWPWVDIGADEFMPETTAIELSASPTRPVLLSVQPNPIDGQGRLRLQVPAAGRGDLRLFDVGGRQRRQWTDLSVPQVIDWDARDAGGRALADGVYFLVFTPSEPVDSPILTARLVLVRGR